MELIDTHCHLDIEVFDADRDQVLAHCRKAGIRRIVVPGITAHGWDRLEIVCDTAPELFPALGLHPVFLEQHSAGDMAILETRLRQRRPLAVGEIGLDFYLRKLDRGRQQALFEAQLGVARTAGLPVILHVRKAHDEVLASLRRIRVSGGICHAFNGSLQQAERYLELNFKLGFGGMLTYPRSHKLHRLAAALPIDALVLETDAPDMTVARHRGQRNSPEYLPEILQTLAEVRGENVEYLTMCTTANTEAVFSFA
jgi:TatD DNase family protein